MSKRRQGKGAVPSRIQWMVNKGLYERGPMQTVDIIPKFLQ